MSETDAFREERKRLEDLAKRRKERKLDDLRKVLKTPEGRRVLYRYMDEAGTFGQSFTGNNNETNFKEGRRYVGVKILNEIFEAKPSVFQQMQREHANEIKQQKREEGSDD